MSYLTAEELLAGSSLTYDLDVPPEVLRPCSENSKQPHEAMRIKLRPLSMHAVQRVLKAAKDDEGLMSALMVKESMVEPELSYSQTMKLNSGLVRFIIAEVQRISGLKASDDELTEAVQAPMAKACFVLAKEFGWSPQQVAELTLGQVLMYVEMIRQNRVETKLAC
jgi:hypothetical protein